MDNHEIQTKAKTSLGEKIHNFLASYEKNPVIDGLIVGTVASAFAVFGGPIASARALGGGFMSALAMKYLSDRAGEIRGLREKLALNSETPENTTPTKIEMPTFDMPVGLAAPQTSSLPEGFPFPPEPPTAYEPKGDTVDSF